MFLLHGAVYSSACTQASSVKMLLGTRPSYCQPATLQS